MTSKRAGILFVQLPQLDNSVEGPHENVRLAAVYLRHAVEVSRQTRRYDFDVLPPQADDWDDAHVVDEIVRLSPSVIACTLYLWNVERSLDVLKRVKARLPEIRAIVGGPEADRHHPFLLRSGVVDAAAMGEGEAVIVPLLQALRTGAPPDLQDVGWKEKSGWTWGRQPNPHTPLESILPRASHPLLQPDANGMAYLETSRGCPLRCVYCLYHHYHRGLGVITPRDLTARLTVLRGRGAREIRFVDPTFNAHPAFDDILAALVRANSSRSLAFFGEIRADTLTRAQADLLAKANVRDVEVGIQSVSPSVLNAIRRPTDLAAASRGIRWLIKRGIRVTVDVMYGLPGQTLQDVKRSIQWTQGLGRVNLQCLQTLLLPGTNLRRNRARWKISAADRPPYGVTSTGTLSADELKEAEQYIQSISPAALDSPASRFVGCSLPDLFVERVRVRVPDDLQSQEIPGALSRRAALLYGADLFRHRVSLAQWIRRAVQQEPHILWQFVLLPEHEEPLDLFDFLIAEVRRLPLHVSDRYAGVWFRGKRAARRIFVQLKKGRRYDPSWIDAVEEDLREAFH